MKNPAIFCMTGALALGFTLAVSASARGASHDEAINGDISDNRMAPTTLNLSAGSNTVAGLFGVSSTPGVQDLDYFTVVVPPGTKLSQVILTQLRAGGGKSFIGIQAGPVMTLTPTSTDPSPLLAYGHIFNSLQGSDLLPAIAIENGLAAGTYTFWMNETDIGEMYPYALDFVVEALPPTPIPAVTPWSAVVTGSALLAIGLFKLRRHPALAPGPARTSS